MVAVYVIAVYLPLTWLHINFGLYHLTTCYHPIVHDFIVLTVYLYYYNHYSYPHIPISLLYLFPTTHVTHMIYNHILSGYMLQCHIITSYNMCTVYSSTNILITIQLRTCNCHNSDIVIKVQ